MLRDFKWRDDEMPVAAVDNDVIEDDLVFSVVSTCCLNALKRSYDRVVLPGLETGLILIGVLRGPLFKASRNLPGTEASKQKDHNSTHNQCRPCGQWLRRPVVHVIMFVRFEMAKSMKYVVFTLLAAILLSLGSGLFYLSRDDADSAKVLRALQIRVALSAVLIIFLVASYYLGWIQEPAR